MVIKTDAQASKMEPPAEGAQMDLQRLKITFFCTKFDAFQEARPVACWWRGRRQGRSLKIIYTLCNCGTHHMPGSEHMWCGKLPGLSITEESTESQHCGVPVGWLNRNAAPHHTHRTRYVCAHSAKSSKPTTWIILHVHFKHVIWLIAFTSRSNTHCAHLNHV